ncbi:hypothetical protein TNCV_4578701 [Trichonephila clavipes]|nr:hypothetical protein TNCV_4578701 [Trichonephila clavipes]
MSLVYADKPQTLDHLKDNIRRVIANIRPQMLEKVIENWTSRLDYIRASRGSPMPEIIFIIISSQSSRHCWRSPLPHPSPLIQRDFGCIIGVRNTKQLPRVANVDLVWQLEVLSGSIIEQPWTTCFLSAKEPESEPAREAIQSGD